MRSRYDVPMTNKRIGSSFGLSLICGITLVLSACGAAATTTSTPAPVEPPVTIVPTEAPAPTAPSQPIAAAEPTATTAPSPQPPETLAPTAPAETSVSVTPALRKIADGLERPTYLTHAGDGTSALYITEQSGRIMVLENGVLRPEPFLDITDRVGSNSNEQGLLSVAFSPDYTDTGKFFVNYTDKRGDTVVAGFLANADRRTADPNSEWTVLQIDQPYPNHNGGQLKFGPDGMLYIGMGDGGSQGDPQNRAQDASDLLGKILRIDVSKSTPDQPYIVPPDNPNLGGGSRPEIWALGLRNPWRFSFDRATGDLFIADVGQNAFEEIDFQPASSTGGENYGWNLREGLAEYAGPMADNFTDPIAQYGRRDGCSVTGGYVYRGAALPTLIGAYIYGDYCSGKIWTLRPNNGGAWLNEPFMQTDFSITSFGEDQAGELYVLDRAGGVYQLVGE
jgi:glucose/arabinose dehydrogenase